VDGIRIVRPVGNRTRHRRRSTTSRKSELEAALVIELHDRSHQANIAFLDKVEKTGKAHHQPQVGFSQLLLGARLLAWPTRSFRGERKFVSPVDPALDLLDHLLRGLDSRGDIVRFRAAVDLNMAPVFSLSCLAQKL
jgi:hypothetical protein